MSIAFFDASGSADSTEALVVAGFISSKDKWDAFERDWRILLDAYEITALHMKDFTQSRRQFAGWDKNEAKRRVFISQLIYVIEAYYFGSAIIKRISRRRQRFHPQ
jgi:hypothetical protein